MDSERDQEEEKEVYSRRKKKVMVYVCVLWSMIRYKGVMLNQQAKTACSLHVRIHAVLRFGSETIALAQGCVVLNE